MRELERKEKYIRHAKKEQLAKQISSLPFPPHKGETNFGFPRKRAGDTKTRRFLLLARSVFSALARSSIFGKFIRPLEEGRNTRRVVAPTHERWNAIVYFFSRPCIPCFLRRVFFAIVLPGANPTWAAAVRPRLWTEGRRKESQLRVADEEAERKRETKSQLYFRGNNPLGLQSSS